MKNHLITFGDTDIPYNKEDIHYIAHGIHRDYKTEADRLFKSANVVGMFDNIYYNLEWLRTTVEYKEFPLIFNKPPYGWAFKPLSIWYSLNNILNGDTVMWVDTNHVFRAYPERIINTALFHSVYTYDHSPAKYMNRFWTHRDMFKSMQCDTERYWNAPHMHANIVCFIKNELTMRFVEEWKNYCCDYDTMEVNKEENLSGYIDHRHDQSVFSILVEKYNILRSPPPFNLIDELDGIPIKESHE